MDPDSDPSNVPCPAGCGRRVALVTLHLDGLPHDHPDHTGRYWRTTVAYCAVCREGTADAVEHDCTGYPTSHSFPVEVGRRYRIGPAELERLRGGGRADLEG